MDASIAEADFTQMMANFGAVRNVRMLPKSKCAFVTYADPAAALNSLALEGHLLGSLRLTLNVGAFRGAPPPSPLGCSARSCPCVVLSLSLFLSQ